MASSSDSPLSCDVCDEIKQKVEHKTHSTDPIEKESPEEKTQTDVHQMIQDRMKKIQEIEHSVEMRKRNTDKEKSSSVKLFTDLIRSFERCQSEQLKMMEKQQKAAEKHAEDLIKELQKEITELKRRNTEIEQLSNTDDHLPYKQVGDAEIRWRLPRRETLQEVEPCLYTRRRRKKKAQGRRWRQMNSSQVTRVDIKNWTDIRIGSDVNSLYRDLTELKRTQETLNKKLSQNVDVTLDPDTANPYLILSDDEKQVRHGDIEQDLPENPKRFDESSCVLAKQGFSSGTFYYEVHVKGKTDWALGVAKESVNRKGEIIPCTENGVWSLNRIDEDTYLISDGNMVIIPFRENPEKVGVFVNYEEGLVSFYNVESRSHIYSFTGQTFTDQLYPCFSPGDINEGKNSRPLIITPVS
ncbi:E3 ubiquitin-protein ligase TRIM39-like [Pseudorasbora parva]|uniref:E3 ubiquitin-protein ligase TRIM39-like n=1 Tax=Pseudorasbora parva TaxID=51549 RepID=UPI00351DD2B6